MIARTGTWLLVSSILFVNGTSTWKNYPLLSSWAHGMENGKWKWNHIYFRPGVNPHLISLVSLMTDYYFTRYYYHSHFSDEETEALRNLKLQATKHLARVIPVVFSKYGVRTQRGWSESSLFPSDTVSRTALLTLVKFMSLKYQNHPHLTSLHSERLIFLYLTQVPLFENHSVLFFFFKSIIPPFNRFFCQASFPGFWLCC